MGFLSTRMFIALACLVAMAFNQTEGVISDSGALDYMRKFGHYPEADSMNGGLLTQEALMDSIKSFQSFAGLNITGELDEDTKNKMEEPRCGNPDIAGTEFAKRKKRYALQGSRWQKKTLTYKITRYTSDLSSTNTDQEIAAAFQWWEDNSDLTFAKAPQGLQPDIEIQFASGSHGDGDPFDGPGRTLAHAYFPQFGGDAHFDESETWRLQAGRGTVKLRIVAAHEFGHSLGLSHSDVNGALMAPFYDPAVTELHSDDIQGIQQLYGPPSSKPSSIPASTSTTQKPLTTTTNTPRPTATPPLGACNGRFDAIVQMTNGSTYAFVGSQFWRLNNQGADEGFPQSTSSVWGIAGKIDGTLAYGGRIDIFQGESLYRFTASGLPFRGYPQPIISIYRGIPSNIDAAFQWSGNGKIYFMKGSLYWRYNVFTRRADVGYPRPLTVWGGLPEEIDAALQWNGRTYFFRDGSYYRLDDLTISVAITRENPYPRRTDEWWLGCTDNTLREAGSVIDGNDNDNTEGGSSITRPNSLLFFACISCLAILSAVHA